MALTHEELFLLTLQDIRDKVRSGTDYELLRACGMYRHLICDSTSLLQIVNEKYNLPIKFIVADWGEMRNWTIEVNWLSPYPPSASLLTTKTIALNVGKFRNHVILSLGSHRYNVEEIIRNVSVFMGGVHSDSPELHEVKKRALVNIEKAVRDKKSPIIFYAIAAIGKIILKAVEPLEILISGRAPAGGS